MLHYSRRTEQAYLYWSRAFIRLSNFESLRDRQQRFMVSNTRCDHCQAADLRIGGCRP